MNKGKSRRKRKKEEEEEEEENGRGAAFIKTLLPFEFCEEEWK
jgi:hypothetical protein